jgi:hypothetical protein
VLKSIVSFPAILSASLFPLPSPSHSISPQPITRLPLPPTHSPPADQPTIPTLHNPNLLQSLTQAPYTTITKIHTNTCQGPKTQLIQHFTQSPPHFLPPILVPS